MSEEPTPQHGSGAVRGRRWAVPGALAAVCVLTSACALERLPAPDLGGLYGRAAQANDAMRNPVIVIPGILGSKLEDGETGRVVWGAFLGTYADPGTPDGARLVALPMAEGTPLHALRDAVQPAGALDRVRVRVLGLPFEQRAYLYILGLLGVGGYRDESLGRMGQVDYGPGHFTCFQFAYDWRRDNAENARRLHEFILAKRAYVQAELKRRYNIERPDLKFDIIAHSMGGLLTRYYLRYGAQELPADGSVPAPTWDGARYVNRAILVAPPNGGSAEAIGQLVEGAALSFVLPRYGPAILGTMPSIYQLLPRSRHRPLVETDGAGGSTPVDLLDIAVWERYRWGLLAPDQERVLAWLLPEVGDQAARRRIAREHLAKALARARQFHAALDQPSAPPPGLRLHLFAGDAIPTLATVAVNPASGALAVHERRPGDGTVLRESALGDERAEARWQREVASPIAWSDVTFVFTDHLAMTRDPAFTDNVLFRLLESPSPAGLGSAGAGPTPRLASPLQP